MVDIPTRPIDGVQGISSSIPGLINPAFAASSVFEADRVLSGLASVYGDIGARAKAAADNNAYHASVTQLDSQWTEQFIAAQKEAPERPIGFATGLKTKQEADIESAVSAAPESIQPQLRDRLTGMVNDYYKRASAFEHVSLIESDKREILKVGENLSGMVLRDPASFDRALAESEAAISDMDTFLPAGDLAELQLKNRESLAKSAIDGMALDNPEVALDAVKSGAFDEYLDADDTANIQANLQRAVDIERRRKEAEARARAAEAKAAQAVLRAANKSVVEDHLNSVAATGRGLDQKRWSEVLSVYPADVQQKLRDQEANAVEEHGIRTEFKQKTPDEIKADIIANTPQPGEGFTEAANRYTRLLKSANEELKAREEDPAAYVSSSPDVVEAFNAASEDPAKIASALDLRYKKQEAIGINNPRMLDNGTASRQAQAILSAPFDQRAQVIETLQSQYGSTWNKAYRDIVDAGLPAETQFLAIDAGNPGRSAQVAAALSVPDKELNDSLPGTSKNDVEAELNSQLQPFAERFVGADWSGKRLGQWNSFVSAANKVAKAQVVAGASPSEAADFAAKSFSENFHLGETYYIPKVIDGLEIDDDHVADILNEKQQMPYIQEFNPQPFGSASKQFEGLQDDEELQRRTIQAAADFGKWVTTPDGLGVELLVPVQGTYIPLINRDGKHYRIDFKSAMSERPNVTKTGVVP